MATGRAGVGASVRLTSVSSFLCFALPFARFRLLFFPMVIDDRAEDLEYI